MQRVTQYQHQHIYQNTHSHRHTTSFTNHGLNGERMTGCHLTIGFIVSVMQNIGSCVKDTSNSMSTKVFDCGEALLNNIIFNNCSNIFIIIAWGHKIHGRHPTIIGALNQFLGSLIRSSHHKHFRAITMVAIEITCNIKIDNISICQWSIIRNAMTNDFIDRGAARFWKSMIIEW